MSNPFGLRNVRPADRERAVSILSDAANHAPATLALYLAIALSELDEARGRKRIEPTENAQTYLEGLRKRYADRSDNP